MPIKLELPYRGFRHDRVLCAPRSLRAHMDEIPRSRRSLLEPEPDRSMRTGRTGNTWLRIRTRLSLNTDRIRPIFYWRVRISDPWLWVLLAGWLSMTGCGPEPERPYGVQLHLHGSMSEGPASMRAHAEAASRLDGAVDVLWWTDHDWRIAAHTYVERFDFDAGLEEIELAPAPLRTPQFDGREPLPSWHGQKNEIRDAPTESLETVHKSWRLNVRPGRLARDRLVEITKKKARHGTGSLHLAIRGTRQTREQVEYLFQASRRRQIASLASGVVVRLSALPVQIDGNARLVIRVGLSQANPERGVRLDYVLSSTGLEGRNEVASNKIARSADGTLQVEIVTIPLEAEKGVWNDWQLQLTRDAELYGVGGEDNALVNLSIGLEASNGGRAELYLDSLVIEREQVGEQLLAAARTIADTLSGEELTHHVGQEISYAAHINAYGEDIPLVDFDSHPHGMTPQEAVAHIHRYEGLASLNHFFGVDFTMTSHRIPTSRASFKADLERLIANKAYGVDLIEVGYRSRGYGLDAFLELWDGLANAGIRLVGIGVSDSHDAAIGWSRGPNNFISWIYARSPSEEDLLEGLRAGRVYFGDPTQFDGHLDIDIDGGGRMGETVALSPGLHRVTFRAEGLTPGQAIRLVRDGQVIKTHQAKTSSFSHPQTIDVQGPGFVRFEILNGEERVAVSNPLYFDLTR